MALHLPATVTLAQASALAGTADQAVMQGVAAGGERAPLVVDASALQGFDTSLLAVLLHARRLAIGAGCAFEIAGAPAKLGQLAQLYGVAELLGLNPAAPSSASAPSAADPGPA